MKFDRVINDILGEELSREDRIKALRSLKYTKENIPSAYRMLVDNLINQHSLEELNWLLAMEKRMQEQFNNGAPMYIRALEYAVAELE